MKNASRIAVVIPAYNESTTIGRVVKALNKLLVAKKADFQIIVVDDGSKDRTAEKAEKAGAYVISHILNVGSGGATATGLSYSQQHGFDIAATLDGDGQHEASDVIKGIELMLNGNYDLLIGSRLINTEGMSRVKILGNKGLSFITYLLFGIHVTDSQSGLRVFSKTAVKSLRWKTSGYEFCSEMLWRAKQSNLIIGEYPIEAVYTNYSKSKGQNNWNAFNIIKSLIQRRILEIFGE